MNKNINKISKLLEELEKKPLRIAVESTNICNANCSFCAYKYSKRQRAIMDFETYKNILEQIKVFNCKELKFTPITGDPFLDPGLVEKIKYAKSLNCFKVIYTFTNLIGLDSDKVDDFVNSGLTKIMISTCFQNREDYKRIFGVDQFDRVMKNIIALLESNKRNGSPIDIAILLRHDKGFNLKNNRYYQKISEFPHKIFVRNDDYDNWSGLIKLENLPKGQMFSENKNKNFPCSQLYNGFIVTPNGDVGVCWARDLNLDLKIGNINEKTLKEIWQGEKIKELRQNWFKGQLSKPCVTCLGYCSILEHSLIQKYILNNPLKYVSFLPKVIGSKISSKTKYLISKIS